MNGSLLRLVGCKLFPCSGAAMSVHPASFCSSLCYSKISPRRWKQQRETCVFAAASELPPCILNICLHLFWVSPWPLGVQCGLFWQNLRHWFWRRLNHQQYIPDMGCETNVGLLLPLSEHRSFFSLFCMNSVNSAGKLCITPGQKHQCHLSGDPGCSQALASTDSRLPCLSDKQRGFLCNSHCRVCLWQLLWWKRSSQGQPAHGHIWENIWAADLYAIQRKSFIGPCGVDCLFDHGPENISVIFSLCLALCALQMCLELLMRSQNCTLQCTGWLLKGNEPNWLQNRCHHTPNLRACCDLSCSGAASIRLSPTPLLVPPPHCRPQCPVPIWTFHLVKARHLMDQQQWVALVLFLLIAFGFLVLLWLMVQTVSRFCFWLQTSVPACDHYPHPPPGCPVEGIWELRKDGDQQDPGAEPAWWAQVKIHVSSPSVYREEEQAGGYQAYSTCCSTRYLRQSRDGWYCVIWFVVILSVACVSFFSCNWQGFCASVYLMWAIVTESICGPSRFGTLESCGCHAKL